MKTSMKEVSAFLVFILSVASTSAILTGYEPNDITNDRRFGCSWEGGSSPGVICTCRDDTEEMKITKNSISSYDTATIEIVNCRNVRFAHESVAEMRTLRNINLKNISSLYFEEHSLKWYGYREADPYEDTIDLSIPSLKINIENSNISQISGYTFEGRIGSIRFDGVVIENADPFAFNALIQTQDITLKNVELKNVREQMFKKFSTENLELDGVRARVVPSRYVHNITVYKTFRITNCMFDTVRPGGFIVYNPRNFEVTNTRINNLDGEGFKVTTKGDVIFKNNHFDVINDGAFRAIFLHEDARAHKATITFDSNVFTKLTRDSLGINEDFQAKFSNLYINETCDCKSIDHNIKEAEFYSDIKCLYEREYVTVEEFKTNKCSIIQSYSNVIIIVVVVLTLAFIIGVVLAIYYRRVYLSKKYGNEKTAKNGNMSLIVPDGRTYRETELHVIVERADLLTTDL